MHVVRGVQRLQLGRRQMVGDLLHRFLPNSHLARRYARQTENAILQRREIVAWIAADGRYLTGVHREQNMTKTLITLTAALAFGCC